VPGGSCQVSIVPAPDCAAGMYSLRLVFRLTEHRPNTWIDCMYEPTPALNLAAAAEWRLRIRAEQPAAYLMLKLVDLDNPGSNHSAVEAALSADGQPLPAGTWLDLPVKLPEEPARRDGITYAGFYVAASQEAIPLNQDLVFYVGQFAWQEPVRPAWPPPPLAAATGPSGVKSVFSGPLAAEGPWVCVSGKDNQTQHVAEFTDGWATFDADVEGWNEFLWSDPDRVRLEPNRTYRLSFSYEVLAPAEGGNGKDATFYSLVRSKANPVQSDVGWQRWNDPAGTSGQRTLTFTTLDPSQYYVIFGVRHCGRIRIGNVNLVEVAAEGGAR